MHLATMHKLVDEFQPAAVVIDPITNLTSRRRRRDEIKAMLTRVIDFLKSQGITAIFTSLTAGGGALEQSEVGISSLMDTWLLLRDVEIGRRAEPPACTSSRAAAWPTPTRCASSC